MHGGASTGPRTAEGRQRVGEATRRRWVEAVLEDGWRLATEGQRAAVVDLLNRLGGSRNATAKALGLTVHGVRRVLDRLPSRPDEADLLSTWTP
jgi:DNA invertase Pin-like site-specific DNA recombinase